jgi:hypothetical protein
MDWISSCLSIAITFRNYGERLWQTETAIVVVIRVVRMFRYVHLDMVGILLRMYR